MPGGGGGAASKPGGTACPGEEHAEGGSMPRENSMHREPVCQRGSSITGLYIAYEIGENLVSVFERKNNSTYGLKKVDLGVSETLFSMIWGVIFKLKDRNKLIFDFVEHCHVEPFNATHPGHAAPPEVWCSSLACCSPWLCCSLLGMLLPLGMLPPCCSPRGMLVNFTFSKKVTVWGG